MIPFISFSSIVYLLVSLIIGGGYAWFLYGKDKILSKKQRYSLAALRALCVSISCWLLLAPLFKAVSYVKEKPLILLINDHSMSVGQYQPTGFDEKIYQQEMNHLHTELAKHYDVKTFHFSDQVYPGLNFDYQGKLSNASAMLHYLSETFVNRNIGAVVLATDGIFNRGGNPLYDLKKINAPFYPVALGDTTIRKDLVLSNVNYNHLVYLNNEFLLEIEVEAFQAKGDKLKLNVYEDGLKVKDLEVPIQSSSFVRSIPVSLKATKKGIRKYQVQLESLQGEVTLKNNHQQFYIEVLDEKRKILLAASSPHPDLAALRQSLTANDHYEVELAIGREAETKGMEAYGLVIFHQIPGISYPGSPLLNEWKKKQIPAWFIVGAQSQLSAFPQWNASLRLTGMGNQLQEVLPEKSAQFSLFNLEEPFLARLSTLDPLLSPVSQFQLESPYEMLFSQKTGRTLSSRPLWFFTSNGSKTAYLLGEGLWKWRIEEAAAHSEASLTTELIAKTVQYLIAKDDKRKFNVFPAKTSFDESDQVIINANLYNDSYEAVNEPEVIIEVKSEDGKRYNYAFSKNGNAYRLDAGTLPQGSYEYAAQTKLGSQEQRAKGAFHVNGLVTEYQQTRANHQLLHTIADQTEGELVTPSQLGALTEKLLHHENIKTINYEERSYEELINFKWIFWCLLSLLTLEWLVRKRNGQS